MNADHKLGRSEAVRDMSRLIHTELTKISARIETRSRLLASNPEYDGYIADDNEINELRTMRSTLDFIHGKIVEL